MKKIVISFLFVIAFFEIRAQVQFKIPDPTIQQGLAELKKADFYTKQLSQLGFSDKDVTIKTYPLRKFYSDVAGPLTKSLVEADRAEFYLEAVTKKNAKGVIYKMEGYIVFSRSDVAADDWGSYNAKFNNRWDVYHQNVTDFLPANQKYLLDPEAVVKLLQSDLSKGKIKANFLSAPYNGYFNDVIRLESIVYATEEMAEKGQGVRTEMVNATEQRYGFLWEATYATYSPDTGYIFRIGKLHNISSEVTVRIENGEPTIYKCYFYNSGEEEKTFNQELGGSVAYDTLFGGLTWVGTDAVLRKKKMISTDVLQGQKLKQFTDEFANQFKKLKGRETKPELELLFKNYITKEFIDGLVNSTYDALQKGFLPEVKLEKGESEIDWVAHTKAAKKLAVNGANINSQVLRNFRLEQGKYKYNRPLEF